MELKSFLKTVNPLNVSIPLIEPVKSTVNCCCCSKILNEFSIYGEPDDSGTLVNINNETMYIECYKGSIHALKHFKILNLQDFKFNKVEYEYESFNYKICDLCIKYYIDNNIIKELTSINCSICDTEYKLIFPPDQATDCSSYIKKNNQTILIYSAFGSQYQDLYFKFNKCDYISDINKLKHNQIICDVCIDKMLYTNIINKILL